MNKLILSVMTVLILLLLAGCGGGTGPETTETSLGDGSTNTTEAIEENGDEGEEDEGSEGETVDAKTLFEVKCSGCHGWDEPGILVSEGKNAALKGQFLKHPKRLDWTDTVKRMRTNGMEVTDEELETIIDYLNKNWRA